MLNSFLDKNNDLTLGKIYFALISGNNNRSFGLSKLLPYRRNFKEERLAKDLNDLVSTDFVDTTTGSTCAASLKFAFLAVVNKGSDLAYIKYRARTGAGDAVTNELPVDYLYSDDIATISTEISTIAFKKGEAIDSVYFVAGFVK